MRGTRDCDTGNRSAKATFVNPSAARSSPSR